MKKLYKSTKDKQIEGVIGGLSELYDIDVSLLRILAVILAFVTSGAFAVVYIIAAIVMPTDKKMGEKTLL